MLNISKTSRKRFNTVKPKTNVVNPFVTFNKHGNVSVELSNYPNWMNSVDVKGFNNFYHDSEEACYVAYFEQNEADSESLCRAGAFLLKERRYAEAITYLEQGLACDGAAEKQELMRNLVIAYEYNGNFDKAWELVQNYVTLYPNDEEAQTEYIFLKNRQIKEVPETESEQTSSDESAES